MVFNATFNIISLIKLYVKSIFVLTHLPKYHMTPGQIKLDRISENYERICLNKWNFFILNLAFWQVGEKHYGKDC